MKVLFDQQVTSFQRYGGVSRYVLALLRELNRLPQVTAQLMAPAHLNRYIQPDDALHPLSFRLDSLQRGIRFRGMATEPLFRLAAALSRPDIVHETAYMRQAATRRHGPAIVTTLHDMILERYPALFERASQQIAERRLALQRAQAIVCISENTRQDLLTRYPEFESKAHVVWHGVDTLTAAASSPAPGTRPYLLYVGTRGGYKNFGRLLLAFGSSPALKRDFQLLCFGGGPLLDSERGEMDRAGLAEDSIIQTEGNDRQLASAYRNARLFVFPSEYEGFGMPLTEAMVQGCPIACSRASSFPEVAADAAVYFDPLDVDALRSALETLALNDDRHRDMSARSSARATQFSWARCAGETAAVYRQALATA
jgi:glycosyltransferase involved in cell wall biosynthesis